MNFSRYYREAFDPNIINIEGEYPKQSDLFTNVIKCV